MKIERLISMIMILLERPRCSAKDLAAELGVTVRTIYRDVETLSLAGVPVVTYPGAGGGIGIMESYKLDKRLFTKEDISVLVDGLASLPLPLRTEERQSSFAKLQHILPASTPGAGRIIIDPTPWGENEQTPPALVRVQQALNETRLLKFEYRRYDGEHTVRIVEPGRLVLKGFSWYLQGYCTLRKDFRVFRLDRMELLEVLPDSFSQRPLPPLTIQDENWRSVGEKAGFEVKLRFPQNAEETVRRNFYSNQVTTDQEGFTVTFQMEGNDRDYGFLMSFGSLCECLSPESVRQRLAQEFHRAAKLYTLDL